MSGDTLLPSGARQGHRRSSSDAAQPELAAATASLASPPRPRLGSGSSIGAGKPRYADASSSVLAVSGIAAAAAAVAASSAATAATASNFTATAPGGGQSRAGSAAEVAGNGTQPMTSPLGSPIVPRKLMNPPVAKQPMRNLRALADTMKAEPSAEALARGESLMRRRRVSVLRAISFAGTAAPAQPRAQPAAAGAAASATAAPAPAAPALPNIQSRLDMLIGQLRQSNLLTGPKAKFHATGSLDPEAEAEAERARDPTAPKPSQPLQMPILGGALRMPTTTGTPWPDMSGIANFGAVLRQRAQTVPKQLLFVQLDGKGAPMAHWRARDLDDRAQRIAYMLSTQLHQAAGSRVALAFGRQESCGFIMAFFGCLYAGVVPVPMAVPSGANDASITPTGFILSNCGISLILTTRATWRTLPRDSGGARSPPNLRGWPPVTWHLIGGERTVPKAMRDIIHTPTSEQGGVFATAFIETTTSSTGDAHAITHTHASLLNECMAAVSRLDYASQTVMVSVLDHRSSAGLVHGIFCAIFCAFTSVFLDFGLFSGAPGTWPLAMSRFRASVGLCTYAGLAYCTSRTTERELRKSRLDSLRLVLLDATKTLPSVSAKFCARFGLPETVVSPMLTTAEAKTVCLRQPGLTSKTLHIDMASFQYDVIREAPTNAVSTLTLQDSGTPLPAAKLAIVRPGKRPLLCQADQVGEICISSAAAGSGYFGLAGKSRSQFQVHPMLPDERASVDDYVRTGWLGFISDGRVFVTGSAADRITTGARHINADDVAKTALQLGPTNTVYHGHAVAFAIALRDEQRIVVAFETQQPMDEALHRWILALVAKIEEVNHISPYAILAVAPDTLPGVSAVDNAVASASAHECRRAFLASALDVRFALMNVSAISNLPPPLQTSPLVGMDRRQMLGDMFVSMAAIEAISRGPPKPQHGPDDVAGAHFTSFNNIAEILLWRAKQTPSLPLYVTIDDRGSAPTVVTAEQLLERVLRLAAYMIGKLGLVAGHHVAVMLPPGVELVAAVHACLYTGIIPILIDPPTATNTASHVRLLQQIFAEADVEVALTDEATLKLLRQREVASYLDKAGQWPLIVTTTDVRDKKKLPDVALHPTASPQEVAYIDFDVTRAGMLAGTIIAHETVLAACRVHQLAYRFFGNAAAEGVVVCTEPYHGVGLIYHCLLSVYAGVRMVLIPRESSNPLLWPLVLDKFHARTTIATAAAMERVLGANREAELKAVRLDSVQNLILDVPARPRADIVVQFTALLEPCGLKAAAIQPALSCDACLTVCMYADGANTRGDAMYVELDALRRNQIELVEKGSPCSTCIMASGTLVYGSTVVVVDPDLLVVRRVREIGEIWVSSELNGKGFYATDDEAVRDNFAIRPVNAKDDTFYARTYLLGFVYQNRVFVTGSLEDSILVRGYRYYPEDVESSIERCHRSIVGWYAARRVPVAAAVWALTRVRPAPASCLPCPKPSLRLSRYCRRPHWRPLCLP